MEFPGDGPPPPPPLHFSPNGFLSPLGSSFRQLFLGGGGGGGGGDLDDPLHLKNLVRKSISPSSLQTVEDILKRVNGLTALEKLLLYLKLPTGKEHPDPLKQPLNPLGSRAEITQTITWIKTHLKVDKETSLPKQDVYDEYLDYCGSQGVKPLSTADFGKVMKQVYPDVRPRRLGTRGNSRYCYSGMTKRTGLPPPTLPALPLPRPASASSSSSSSGGGGSGAAPHHRLLLWAGSVLGVAFASLADLEDHVSARLKPNLTNGDAFISSCKIPKVPISPGVQRKSAEFNFKRKIEEDSSSSSKTPPEGGKRSRPLKRAKSTEAVRAGGGGAGSRRRDPPPPPPPPLDLKPRPASEILENGNSLEQEEELARYFEVERPIKSQLRMLLEKTATPSSSSSVSCAAAAAAAAAAPGRPPTEKRVSFTALVPPSPNTQKKFSFVPISPISAVSDSPFLSPRPKETPLLASMLVGGRGVSTQQEEVTPVPSSPADFQESCESGGFLVLDGCGAPPVIDSGELSHIFSLLDSSEAEAEAGPGGKCGDPVVSGGGPVGRRPRPPLSLSAPPSRHHLDLLDDDLPLPSCDDSFDDFAREVTHIGSSVMPPDL